MAAINMCAAMNECRTVPFPCLFLSIGLQLCWEANARKDKGTHSRDKTDRQILRETLDACYSLDPWMGEQSLGQALAIYEVHMAKA